MKRKLTNSELPFNKRCWLLLDCDSMMHQSHYAMGHLAHYGESTGALYGFLRDLVLLQRQFNAPNTVFCFDRGPLLRELDYPEYKENREKLWSKKDTDDQEAYRSLHQQTKVLRDVYLPELGFVNVYEKKGYEADDLLAAVAQQFVDLEFLREDEAIIVTGDHDLYQVLQPFIRVWHPGQGGRLVTINTFRKEWGIFPHQWADVKALAGCVSDAVLGLPGVGEKTAAKYLRGELPEHHKTHQTIKQGGHIWSRNLKLVKLPYHDLKVEPIQREDAVSPERWRKLMRSLGMESMVDNLPLTKGTA